MVMKKDLRLAEHSKRKIRKRKLGVFYNEVAIVGLGKMGSGMARRLIKNNFRVIVYNRSFEKTRELSKQRGIASYSLNELVSNFKSNKKIIWLMLPGGKITTDIINRLLPLLKKGDIIINGANSFYKLAESDNKLCTKYKINFFDIGVSNGINGEFEGYTLMIGGDKNQLKYIQPLCKALAPEKGYEYFGQVGSGHYVKSVHNIIEYVYLEGLAEGIELLDKKNINLEKATSVFKNSVIKSELLDLTNLAVKRKNFNEILPKINSVTIEELEKTKSDVKAFTPSFDQAVKIRKDKSGKFQLGKRVIAAVRKEFGGHEVVR